MAASALMPRHRSFAALEAPGLPPKHQHACREQPLSCCLQRGTAACPAATDVHHPDHLEVSPRARALAQCWTLGLGPCQGTAGNWIVTRPPCPTGWQLFSANAFPGNKRALEREGGSAAFQLRSSAEGGQEPEGHDQEGLHDLPALAKRTWHLCSLVPLSKPRKAKEAGIQRQRARAARERAIQRTKGWEEAPRPPGSSNAPSPPVAPRSVSDLSWVLM